MAAPAANHPQSDPDRVCSVLGPGDRYEGLMAFRGDARIDGELVGEIVAQGTLWIGEGARVRARIEADQLIVAGEVTGEIFVRNRVEMRSTAVFEGSLVAAKLVLEEGSLVSGPCRTGSASEPSPAPSESHPSP